MDTFASDLACIVRNLFPEDKEMDCGGGANNKRKRSSVFAALSPSPMRGVRNIPKSKGTDATARTASTAGTSTCSKGLSVSGARRDGLEGQERRVQDSEIKKNLFVDDRDLDFDDRDDEEEENDDDTSISPSEIFSERFSHVLSYYPANSDYLVIRDAIIDSGNDGVDPINSRDVPVTSFTLEQVNTIRVMVVTPKRQKIINDMGRLILGPQFGRQRFDYKPGFWYTVLRSYETFKQIFAAEKDVASRFDLLFGFTRCLDTHNRWLTHHGRSWGGEKMIAGLAVRWKHMLQYSAQQLELDEEFSLPAVLCFAAEFKTTVEAAEMYGDPPLKFDYV